MTLAAEIERDIAIMEAASDIIPREVEKVYPNRMFDGTGTCVFTSRVTLETFRHFGIKGKPVPCHVAIFNAAMVNRVSREGRFPADMTEAKAWGRQDGSWGVSIGKTGNTNPSRLDAHLVIVTHEAEDNEGVLCDFALPQNDRPQRKIILQPVLASLPEGFFSDEQPLVVRDLGPQNCAVRYAFEPGERGNWNGKDWTDPERWRAPVAEVIRRVEQRLSG